MGVAAGPNRRTWMRRGGVGSGLVLFAHLLGHLLNTAAGLISLAAMERGLDWMMAAWGNPVGRVLLYGALFVHFALSVSALYTRRSLRLSLMEATQFALGFAIPALLIGHVV